MKFTGPSRDFRDIHAIALTGDPHTHGRKFKLLCVPTSVLPDSRPDAPAIPAVVLSADNPRGTLMLLGLHDAEALVEELQRVIGEFKTKGET